VFIQRRGDDRFVSTPELSFAIRHLGAHAGLNISASHNPPDDNGGKFYNQLGGQEIPPYDEAMVARVEQVEEVDCLSWQKAKDSGYLQPFSDKIHQAYVWHVQSKALVQSRSAKVVYTPLHGTGLGSVYETLRNLKFDVQLVEEQAAPDGDFPTVPFCAPNPEVPRSMDLAVEKAKLLDADLVLSTDPDADRIGAVVKHKGEWRFLNGNEIGTLVVHHALTQRRWKDRPVVFQTEVTSGFISRMATAMNAQVVDHLLVGFKYVGEALRQLEENQRYGKIRAQLDDFAVAVEESHGVLITPQIRDKDAAGGALYLTEAACLAKDQGRTLVDVLESLWTEHGYVSNALVSTVMRGAVGRVRIQAIQESFRRNPPRNIGGLPVTAFYDRRDPQGVFGPVLSETDRASRDVLVFELGEEARVLLRPSGTEPKNKAYVEFRGKRGAELATEQTRVNTAAKRLAEAFVEEMLSRVDLGFPAFAHDVSDLVPVEGKISFSTQIFPELLRRLDDSAVDSWLDAALAPLGKDARRLVDRAVVRWIRENSPSVDVHARLETLFSI